MQSGGVPFWSGMIPSGMASRQHQPSWLFKALVPLSVVHALLCPFSPASFAVWFSFLQLSLHSADPLLHLKIYCQCGCVSWLYPPRSLYTARNDRVWTCTLFHCGTVSHCASLFF
ncbi:hypothetical protein I7I53_10774 [Histoplasma capsulatum var. duboisii H88]|uniref:Uncharacterized protein n=1 Tax=Ajellomyces capsulatus (strain H88) TaxID=544711 RepID=A0A8A1LBY7_AJEC8|nr:hypothetical protein I7I53_10774 [Histoplasma capsulatum var. duboisii H88]